MQLRKYAAALAIVPALALADSAYQLDLGAEMRGNSLRVEPTVVGPAEVVVPLEKRKFLVDLLTARDDQAWRHSARRDGGIGERSERRR